MVLPGMKLAANSSMRTCECGVVDQHAIDAARQFIAQDARGQRQVFVNQLAGMREHAPFFHVLPQAPEILDVVADLFHRRALRRGAHDVSAVGLLRHGFGHQRLQARALGFVLDARGDADAFAARHVHHEARRQRHEGRQARTLGAHRILDHLHEDVIAFLDEACGCPRRSVRRSACFPDWAPRCPRHAGTRCARDRRR